MIRRPPRSTLSSSSAASDVYKRQVGVVLFLWLGGRNSRAREYPSSFTGIGCLCVRRFSAHAYSDRAPIGDRRYGARFVRHATTPGRLRQKTVKADRK